MSELMTSKQCMAYLGIAQRTLYKWIKEKRIPYLKVGNQYRFRPEQIDAWLEKGMEN